MSTMEVCIEKNGMKETTAVLSFLLGGEIGCFGGFRLKVSNNLLWKPTSWGMVITGISTGYLCADRIFRENQHDLHQI